MLTTIQLFVALIPFTRSVAFFRSGEAIGRDEVWHSRVLGSNAIFVYLDKPLSDCFLDSNPVGYRIVLKQESSGFQKRAYNVLPVLLVRWKWCSGSADDLLP